MARYYVVKGPMDDEAFNMYVLYKLSMFKSRLIGVYYIPRLRYYGPVLRLDSEEASMLKDVLWTSIGDDALENSFRMVCLRGCGWECERDSNVFAFENEIEDLPIDKEALPMRGYRFRGIAFRAYWLDLGPSRACIFYDRANRACRIHEVKPVICRVTYCARYAIRGGDPYVRVKSVELKGGFGYRYVITFRRVVDEEGERLLRLIQA